ncbi:MAG: hypothetical protein ABI557_01825, partial [Aureliella sp.]
RSIVMRASNSVPIATSLNHFGAMSIANLRLSTIALSPIAMPCQAISGCAAQSLVTSTQRPSEVETLRTPRV